MGLSTSKDRLFEAIRSDQNTEVKKILEKFPDLKNAFINKNNDHTSLCMAAYFGSFNSFKYLVDEGHDMNQPEKKEGNTPIIIASKRNLKAMVNYLIEKGANLKHRNNLNLTALDYAVIHGNYEIAYNLKNKELEVMLKSLDEYLEKNSAMKVPCFNIPLFYQSLNDNLEPGNTPAFYLTMDEKNKLEGKIPDPNETWSEFFNRCLNFKLYKPPLVSKNSVPLEKRQSLFVRMQTKLLEMEYDKSIPLDDDKSIDIELGSNSISNVNKDDSVTMSKIVIEVPSNSKDFEVLDQESVIKKENEKEIGILEK